MPLNVFSYVVTKLSKSILLLDVMLSCNDARVTSSDPEAADTVSIDESSSDNLFISSPSTLS